MRKIIFTILPFVLLTIVNQAVSQDKCTDYDLKNCEAYGDPYKYSGQSKNAYFEKGQTSDFKLVCYAGFEYRVSLCPHKNLEGIFFRIREDNVNRNILYDSSTEEVDYLEKMFYVEKSKNLIIEVIVPEDDKPKSEQKYRKRFGCVGVMIEYNRRASTGFE